MDLLSITSVIVVLAAMFGYLNARYLRLPNAIGLMLITITEPFEIIANRMKCQRTLIVHWLLAAALILCASLVPPPAQTIAQTSAQDTPTADPVLTPDEQQKPIETPDRVEVQPLAVDEDISARLERIYKATGWFESAQVTTDEGVVFLKGMADTQQHREWAERVAQRTSDVVAVVNRIDV